MKGRLGNIRVAVRIDSAKPLCRIASTLFAELQVFVASEFIISSRCNFVFTIESQLFNVPEIWFSNDVAYVFFTLVIDGFFE